MTLQDSHLHLQDAEDPSVPEAILAGAPSHGVGRLFCNATSSGDWDAVLDLARRSSAVVPFLGVHPWYVAHASAGWDSELERRLAASRAGVGEIGLDYRKSGLDRARQLDSCARQLDIAARLGRPVALHCVDAWGPLIGLIRARVAGKVPVMVHLFSGSAEMAKELSALGVYLSFSSGIMDGGPKRLRAAFLAVPQSRLLLETDYPYARCRAAGTVAGAAGYFPRLEAVYRAAGALTKAGGEKIAEIVWDNGSVFVH